MYEQARQFLKWRHRKRDGLALGLRLRDIYLTAASLSRGRPQIEREHIGRAFFIAIDRIQLAHVVVIDKHQANIFRQRVRPRYLCRDGEQCVLRVCREWSDAITD